LKNTLLPTKAREEDVFPPGDQSHYFNQGWIIHGQQLQTSQKGNRKKSLARAQTLPSLHLEKPMYSIVRDMKGGTAL